MLRAIHLKRFGLFEGQTFALDAVTVFCGTNQSGKSTVFDAIRIHAFQPDKRRKEHRALYARYGEDTEVGLDWAGEPLAMSDATFMNLYALSGGDARMDLDGEWLEAVKKNLFAGGIDPRNLIEAFGQAASDKGSYRHMRRRGELEKERAAAEARLASLQDQRGELLAGMEGQQTRRDQLKGMTAHLAQLEGEERQLAAEVAEQERIAQRVTLEEQLTLVARVAELERRQAAREHLTVDRTEELDVLEAAARGLETDQARVEQALALEREAVEKMRTDARRAAGEMQARATWRDGLEAVEARLDLFEGGRFTAWVVRGALAAFLAAAGAGLLALSGGGGWGWLALAGGIALAGALLWGGNAFDQWRLRSELKDLWRNRLGGSVGLDEAQTVLKSATLKGLREALFRVRSLLDGLENEKNGRDAALAEAEQRIAAVERQHAEGQAEAEGARKKVADWLGRLRVSSRDEYRDQLAEFRRARQELAEGDQALDAVQAEGGFADRAHLKADLERKLGELDAAGVARQGVSEGELRALRERLEALRTERTAAETTRHALDRDSHGAAERLTGALGNLPDEIAALDESLHRLETRIEALDFDRRAAGVALEIFEELAADETAVLADLSAAVAEVFGRLTGLEHGNGGAGEARGAAVRLSGLRHEALQALDRQGQVRPAGNLSSGARYLLYLALRLEMARRERQGEFALLCLDEPFAFVDPARQLETLQYLQEFQGDTGWQLILFTNDPAHADRVRAVFPDCRIYDLA